MASKIEAVALAISMDTASFRKEIEYTQRLLNQSKAAFRDVGKVVELLDAALEKNIITEQQYAATVNKATLASEKQQAALRNEAMAVKELTAAREKAAAVELARSRDTLGLGAFAGAQGKPGDRANQFVPDYMRGGNKQTIEELEALRAQALEAQAALEGWANGLKRINLSPLARQINDTRTGAEAWSTGVRKMAEAARATAEEIRRSQAALTGWANGLKQINLSTLAQELQSSRAGAAAWSEGVRKMADAARANAIAVREAQAALEGWANGLKRINLSPLARQLQDSRDGAIAWAQGLERAAAAAKAAASAAGQLERQARQGSRTAFLEAFETVLDPANDIARADERTARAAAERKAARQEGLQYLQQFESRQQRVNRQLAEASTMYGRAAINATEYQNAVRQIRSNNTAIVQGFNQFRGAMLSLVGPLVLLVKAWEGFKATIRLSAELDAARAKFRVFTGSIVQAERLLQEIRQLAQNSPVSFVGGQRAVTTMLQFGVATNDVVAAMKQIAEITGGDTERMNNLALAYSQSAAAGRLMGQELLQMVNAGFNPLKVISEQTGESLVNLKKRMEEGGVSFKAVAKAFEDATAEGGKFNGLLEEVAGTTAGKIVKATSQLEQLGTALGKAIDPAVRGTLTVFTKVVQELTDALNGPQTLAFADKLNRDLEEARYTLDRIDSSSITAILVTLGKDRDAVVEQIKNYERQLAVLKNIAKIREQIARGDEVSTEERAIVARVDNERRTERKTTDGEYDILRKQLERDLKEAVGRQEGLQLRVDFVDTVGEGRVNDEDLKYITKYRAELEKMKEAAALAAEAEKAFSEAVKKAEESIIDSRYGDRSEEVKLLLKQSVDGERQRLEGLVDEGASIDRIVASVNEAARAELERFQTISREGRLLKEQADLAEKLRLEAVEEAARRKEQDDNFREELKNLQSKAQYLRDIVQLGKEEARIEQLMRDDGLNQVEAELRQAAEARLEAEEKIAEATKEQTQARIDADKSFRQELTNLRSKTQYLRDIVSLGKEEARIEQLMRDDGLNQVEAELRQAAEASLEAEEKIAESRKQATESRVNTTSASAPRAIQAGSAEAFALQANLQAKSISDQIRLADRAFLVQKATADATKKTAATLDALKDNLGALPTP